MVREYRKLSLGSGDEHMRAPFRVGRKRDTYVDPAYKSTHHFERFRLLFMQSELSALTAHRFLDRAIRERRRYKTIEINMPLGGITSRVKDFSGLCKKMATVLPSGGRVEILTETWKDKTKIALPYKLTTEHFERPSDTMNLGLLDYPRMTHEDMEDIPHALASAGFDIQIIDHIPQEIINRSSTARKYFSRELKRSALQLIIATKK